MFEGYRITSPYGWRTDPINGSKAFHTGIDLVKYHRAPIPAFVPGEVIHAKMGVSGTGFGGYGIVVAVKDKYGKLHCYCHLAEVSVSVGQHVVKGQIVGLQGNTGRSTGSHLHYEVRAKSSPHFGWKSHIDPEAYLKEYFAKEEKAMYEELKKQIERLTQEIGYLNKRVKAPKWFVDEFGSADLNGMILDPQLTEEGWRILAIALRLQGKGDGAKK